jgi:C_GCAxxG_C_C family probable redox protein
VLSSFGDQFGLARELSLRVAGAFGGGTARMGETCGVVTGALMAIGLKYGKVKAEDDKAREQTYELARDFVTRFRARRGSTICRELLGYNLGIPEERKAAHEKGLFATLCPQLVRDAVEIVEEIV